jgi:Carboxypeptidase regulatory-like domain
MDKSRSGIFSMTLLSILICLLLGTVGPAFAQTSNAEVSGLVTDSSGASVPGVKVTVVNTNTNVTVAAETNESGVYVVSQLVPGVYKVTITKTGFKTTERSNMVFRTGDRLSLNFTLEVGAVTQTIEVTSAAPLLTTSDARNANVIDNKMISQLPQLNRNTLDYMSANPSVQGSGPVQMGASNSYMVGLKGAQFTLAGGQPNGTSVSIDGANMNEGDSNVLNRAVPSPDAIGELRVQTGVLTADSGRYSGGIVTASTLSGTNRFHGKGFEYFRNQSLNANSWYNNNHNIVKDVSHQNNYGGAIGGPIWIPKLYNGRDRTFFFVAYEGQRFKTGSESQSTVPTAEERQGNFTDTIAHWDPVTGQPVPLHIFDPYNGYTDSNGNWVRPEFPNAKIPQSQWSKPGAAILNLYPMPNHAPLFNTSNQNNYWSPIQSSFPIERLTVRVDENISAAHRLNVRVSRYNASNNTSAPFKDGQASTQNDLDWSGSLQYVWAASPSSVFEVRAGFSYSNLLIATGQAPDPSLDITTLGFDPMLFTSGNFSNKHILPGNDFGSIYYTPIGGYYPDRMPAQNFNATAAYTKIWGRHTIKVGFEYYHTAMHEYGGDPSGVDRMYAYNADTQQLWNADNNTGFAGASLLLGAATVDTYGQFNYSPFMRSFAGYVMDDWKVNSKLTVQIGLRIDHDGPKKMKYASTGVVWDLAAKNVLTPNANWNWSQVQATDPALASLAQPGWVANGVNGRAALLNTPEYPGNVIAYTDAAVPQPRLAISYALDNKTVIHASGGLIYQGLYGLNMDAGGNIYYGKDIFNQVLTLDGQHYISELGTGRGLGSFPVQPDGSHLGYVPAITTNANWYYNTFGQIPSPASGVANLMDRHQGSPQEVEWGLTIERQLGTSWVAKAEYTGIHGYHMVQPINAFQFTNVPTQYYSLGSHLYDSVPNPFNGQSAAFSGQPTIPLWHLLSQMPQYSSAGLGTGTVGYMKANYLNLQIQSRGYHGLVLLAAYTIRKTLTTSGGKDWRSGGPGNGPLQDPNNLNEAYGPATYELPQRLLLDYSYDLPVGHGRQFMGNPSSFAGKILDNVIGGWGVAGITSFWPKGTIVAVPGVPNKNGAPNEAVRYSLNGAYKSSSFDPSCALVRDGAFVSPSPCGYFNLAAFVRTPDYTFGNTAKYFPDVRNPGGFSTDGTVMKNFYFSEDHARYLNIRVEGVDFFNHPNYGTLRANPNSIGFGGLNGKSGNRIMQIGARIFF